MGINFYNWVWSKWYKAYALYVVVLKCIPFLSGCVVRSSFYYSTVISASYFTYFINVLGKFFVVGGVKTN